MKRYQKLGLICLLLIVCAAAVISAAFSQVSQPKSPEKQALNFYREYLSACEESYADAISYVYFANDWEEEAWMGSGQDHLVEYEILNGPRQLNESLFVIQCNLQTAAELTMGISPAAAYNFVAIIDGQYYVITHTRNIPPDLHKGFDISIYTNTSDNEVMPDELL